MGRLPLSIVGIDHVRLIATMTQNKKDPTQENLVYVRLLQCTHIAHRTSFCIFEMYSHAAQLKSKVKSKALMDKNTLLIAEIGQKNQKKLQTVAMHSHDTQNKFLHF